MDVKRLRGLCCGRVGCVLAIVLMAQAQAIASEPVVDKSVDEAFTRIASEAKAAYEAGPFSVFSKDYFARITRDPDAKVGDGELEINSEWRLVVPARPDAITVTMKAYFEDFLGRCMQVKLAHAGDATAERIGPNEPRVIVWRETGGGLPGVADSFTIEVTPQQVVVSGHDPRGLRDGVVRLVDMMGLRQAPIVRVGKTVCRPRLPVRLGAVPWLGSLRELVFLGYNAMCVFGGSLYGLSTSDAIAELKDRRNPQSLAEVTAKIGEAGRHGVKTYLWVDTRLKFAKDHPVFKAHPEIRGTLTWKADGEYVLCTEQPLVQQYLCESVEGLFRSMPQLDGLMIIIGGEGFYHCYMRSFGVPKGRSACPRCDKLGGEQAVANLCNMLAAAARKVNPNAEVIAWPYSAEHVWSADRDQAGLVKLFKPGAGLLTEVEKDEVVDKPQGFKKALWDYSIDLIGPGDRAKRQTAVCRAARVPIHIKSEPEWTFEAPRLPFIPCMDRWLARANAMAGCGATGAWMLPIKPSYGSSVAEVSKFAWWEPVPPADQVLEQLAERIAGRQAGRHLRQAWKHVSDAIPFSPELPSYYTGPYYLGPGQPMCADPKARLPEVFYGRYLFMGEATDAEGLMLRPTFNTSPTGNVPVFGTMYRQMEEQLRQAAMEVKAAEPLVPERLKLLFEDETLPLRWFYHTARTEANFYESCQLRDRLLTLAEKAARTADEQSEAGKLYARWREVLEDEKQNTGQALPIMQRDMRLDYYFGSDHSFSHGVDVLQAKLELIEGELRAFLPSVAAKCGIAAAATQRAELPTVIPCPQAMRKLSDADIVLGEGGSLVARTVAAGQGGFYDEAVQLISAALQKKGLTAGSRPVVTTIVLSTQSEIKDGTPVPVLPTLSTAESETLTRSDQAYVIRMRPGPDAKVWIIGASPLGVYYGATTLVQLMASAGTGTITLPHVEIQDYPDTPGRMCADWVLAWDWEVNGYDWGDGLDAFITRCKSKIDLCARYKVNRIRFLGGRISPGPAYMKQRYEKILRFGRELNQHARRKGVVLQYSSTSFGIDHYSWGLPYPEPWVLNRKTYPDGEVYECVGGTAGGCLSNDALIDLIIKRQKQLVQDIEPGSLYLHNIDTALYKDLVGNWKKRCPRCRERWPDDEPYSARGYAAAVANLYNRITVELRSVTDPATGYDASRDLEIVFASPGYSYWTENDAEWESDLKYFSEIARQVKDKRNVQLTFREQYNRLDGRGLRTAGMARALEQVGWPRAMFMFAVQGADFLDSPNLFTSSPVLTGAFAGVGTLYNFNGHVFSEPQVLANANYAWNHRASGAVDPGKFAGTALREEAARYSAGQRHSDFLYGDFLNSACAAAYGEKAGPIMADVLRLERDKGPVVPLVAWIDYQWKNAAYDWRGQADRNLQAKMLVDRAADVCDTDAKAELVRMGRCLEVVAKICMLCDALYREKLSKAEIDTRTDALLAWLDASFQFQVTEPDGGDPGMWKQVVTRLSDQPH